jgi:hypothetical protein
MFEKELSEFYKYKLKINKFFYSPESTNTVIAIILNFIILITIFISIKNSKNKVKTICLILLITYLILYIINYKMLTNTNLTDKIVSLDDIKHTLNTGDIVTYRTYVFDSLLTPYRELILSFQNIFFSHSGMIYKNAQGNLMIIESNEDTYFSRISNKEKSGFMLLNLNNKVNFTDVHRIHIYRNNLHKFIDNDKLHLSIEKYKNYDFLQDGYYCINILTKILQENGVFINENRIIPYSTNDLIDSNNYTVPVVFEEPVIVKQI